MIDAIARLGALTMEESLPPGLDRYTDLDGRQRRTLGALVEPPGVDEVLVLDFDRDPPTFRGHHREGCDNGDPLRYLYRAGHSKGALALPYGQVTGRVVSNRLVMWATDIKKERDSYRDSLTDREIAWLEALADEILARQTEISRIVDEVQSSTPSKIRLFLSVAIADGEKTLPLGHPSLPFARLFLARHKARMFQGVEGQVAVCSLCGRTTAVSHRFGSNVFPFATFDQPTYVAGGLERRFAWRSFALCAECHLLADQGRRFVEQRLTRRIGVGRSSLSYWVVPSLLSPETQSEDAREVMRLLERQSRAGKDLTRAARRVLLASENDLLDELKELGDCVSFTLAFVEKVQARERVLMTVEDVLPSRLRRLFDVKRAVEESAHADGYLPQAWEFTLHHHLVPVCQVDHGGDRTDLRRADFLAILDHVFRGVALESSYVAEVFMSPLHARFASWCSERRDDTDAERRFMDTARAAWLSWRFLDGLGVIHHNWEVESMETVTVDQPRPAGPYFEWLEGFFAGSARTFRHDAARAAFLMGCLTDSVREVQLKHLKAAPFTKHLKSLKMEQRDLLALLPRITQKLTEYEAYTGRNRRMLEAASFYLARAGIEPWPLTSAEINLLFAMGMSLAFVVRRGPGRPDGAEEPAEPGDAEAESAEAEDLN